MTSFSFLEYFNAFELDVNVVNFVYYGKTRMPGQSDQGLPVLLYQRIPLNKQMAMSTQNSRMTNHGLFSIAQQIR